MTTSTTLTQQPDSPTMTPLVRRSEAFFRALLWVIAGYLVLRKQRQNLVGLLLLVWAGGFASYGISVEIDPAAGPRATDAIGHAGLTENHA